MATAWICEQVLAAFRDSHAVAALLTTPRRIPGPPAAEISAAQRPSPLRAMAASAEQTATAVAAERHGGGGGC